MKRLIVALLVCSGPTFADVTHTLPPPNTPPSETNVIRIWGHPELRDIVERWRDAYRSQDSNLRFEIDLSGSDIAMAGLYTGQADLALLGRDTIRDSGLRVGVPVQAFPVDDSERQC